MLHRSIGTILLIILGVATAHGATYDIASSLGDLSTQLDLLTEQLLTFSKDITENVAEELERPSEEVVKSSYEKTIKQARSLSVHRIPTTRSSLPFYETAVIVVDIQRDFVNQPFGDQTAGSLPANGTTEAYTKAAEKFVETLRHEGYLIVFTADNHPQGHVSFFSRWKGQTDKNGRAAELYKMFTNPFTGKDQKLWPDHCVQRFSNVKPEGVDLMLSFSKKNDLLVQKGMDLNYESYSGFENELGKPTAMKEALQILGIKNLIVIGVATDFCVQQTVLDALTPFRYDHVYVVTNLCRGVNENDSLMALMKMKSEGAQLIDLKDAPEDYVTGALLRDKNELFVGSWHTNEITKKLMSQDFFSL